MENKTRKIVLAAMLSALACVATMVIRIPAGQGYLNLGDSVVLLSGWLLSPMYGFFAAAIGSAMADLFAGYALYAPITFLIKGCMALLVSLIYKRNKSLPALFLSAILAEILMAGGYYLFEGFLYGFLPSLASLPMNLLQGLLGLVIGLFLKNVFYKANIMK